MPSSSVQTYPKIPSSRTWRPQVERDGDDVESDCLLAHAGLRQTTFRAARKEEDLTFDGKKPDLILCSPLKRCLITCFRGFKQYPNIPIIIMPELREIYHGCSSKKQVLHWLHENQDMLDYKVSRKVVHVPINESRITFSDSKGYADKVDESFKDITKRLRKVVRCLELNQGKSIVVVGHAAFFKRLLPTTFTNRLVHFKPYFTKLTPGSSATKSENFIEPVQTSKKRGTIMLMRHAFSENNQRMKKERKARKMKANTDKSIRQVIRKKQI